MWSLFYINRKQCSLNKRIIDFCEVVFQNLKKSPQKCALDLFVLSYYSNVHFRRLVQIQIISNHLNHKKSVKWWHFEILWHKNCVNSSKTDFSIQQFVKEVSSKVKKQRSFIKFTYKNCHFRWFWWFLKEPWH